MERSVLTPPTPEEWIYTLLLLGWVLFVAMPFTRWTYGLMRKRGLEHHVAVYFNRKIIEWMNYHLLPSLHTSSSASP